MQWLDSQLGTNSYITQHSFLPATLSLAFISYAGPKLGILQSFPFDKIVKISGQNEV